MYGASYFGGGGGGGGDLGEGRGGEGGDREASMFCNKFGDYKSILFFSILLLVLNNFSIFS